MNPLHNLSILFVGPMPPPINGQSFSFEGTTEAIECKRKYIINQNLEAENVMVKLLKTAALFPRYLFMFAVKKIDLVYFTNTRSFAGSLKDVVLILLASLFGKKIVSHIHGAELKQFIDSLPKLYKRLVLFAYSKIDCHIILIEQMREQLLPFVDGRKIKVVPNFYDPQLDEFILPERNNDPIIISYFSNLVYSKGIFDVIDAYKRVVEKYSNVHLQLAGEYMSDEYMQASEVSKRIKEELQSHPGIHYHGILKGRNKAAFLASSHLFILPTFYKTEALPISVIEAMRSGCVLICTDHNYLKYFIPKESGTLVGTRNIPALQAAIEMYIADPVKRAAISTFNSGYAEMHFSTKAYKKEMNRLFASVVLAGTEKISQAV